MLKEYICIFPSQWRRQLVGPFQVLPLTIYLVTTLLLLLFSSFLTNAEIVEYYIFPLQRRQQLMAYIMYTLLLFLITKYEGFLAHLV